MKNENYTPQTHSFRYPKPNPIKLGIGALYTLETQNVPKIPTANRIRTRIGWPPSETSNYPYLDGTWCRFQERQLRCEAKQPMIGDDGFSATRVVRQVARSGSTRLRCSKIVLVLWQLEKNAVHDSYTILLLSTRGDKDRVVLYVRSVWAVVVNFCVDLQSDCWHSCVNMMEMHVDGVGWVCL